MPETARTYNEKVNKFTTLVERYNTIKNIDDDPSKEIEIYTSNAKIYGFALELIHGFIKKGTIPQVISFVKTKLPEIANFGPGPIVNAANRTSPELSGMFDSIYGNDDLSDEEKLNQMLAKFQDIPENLRNAFNDNLYHTFAISIRTGLTAFTNREDLDKFISNAVDTFGDINYDELHDVDDVHISAFDHPELADNHPYKDKIDAYISELNPENDRELIEILNNANELIIEGKASFVSETSDVAEAVGKASDNHITQQLYDFARTQPYGNNIEKTARHINFKNNVAPEVKENEYDDVLNSNITLSEDYKNKIREIFSLCRETGIFGGAGGAEQSVKSYAFTALVDANNELRTAIDNKNPEQIRQAYRKASELREKYDTILNKCTNLSDSMFVVSNISSSRVPSVPAKYRNDIVGVSRLNGLSILNSLLLTTNTSLEDVLNDPVGTAQRIAKYVVREDNLSNTYMKTHSIDDIVVEFNKFTSGAIGKALDKDRAPIDYLERAFGAIIQICPDPRVQVELNAKLMLFQQSYVAEPAAQNTEIYNPLAGDRGLKTIENLLICEPKDRTFLGQLPSIADHYDINTRRQFETPNYTQYLMEEKTSVAAIITRMDETLKNFDAKYPNNPAKQLTNTACRNLATTILNDPNIEKSTVITNALRKISNNNIKNISRNDLTAIKLASGLPNARGLDVEGFKATITGLSEFERSYNSRNFFAKLLFPSVRAQKRLINELKESIVAKEIRREELDLMLNQAATNNANDLDAAVHDISERFTVPEVVNENNEEVRVRLTIDINEPAVQNQNDEIVVENQRSLNRSNDENSINRE